MSKTPFCQKYACLLQDCLARLGLQNLYVKNMTKYDFFYVLIQNFEPLGRHNRDQSKCQKSIEALGKAEKTRIFFKPFR